MNSQETMEEKLHRLRWQRAELNKKLARHPTPELREQLQSVAEELRRTEQQYYGTAPISGPYGEFLTAIQRAFRRYCCKRSGRYRCPRIEGSRRLVRRPHLSHHDPWRICCIGADFQHSDGAAAIGRRGRLFSRRIGRNSTAGGFAGENRCFRFAGPLVGGAGFHRYSHVHSVQSPGPGTRQAIKKVGSHEPTFFYSIVSNVQITSSRRKRSSRER